jgi:ketosteroid isomerase-like protein
MSHPHEQIVRRVYEHLNRGDVGGVIEECDDGLVMDFSERVFNPDTYQGPEGIRRFYEGVLEIWRSYRWEVEETRVAGDSVIALLHCHAEGRQGGPPVDWRVAWLWRFRDGRPVFLRFYRDRAKALESVGLGA